MNQPEQGMENPVVQIETAPAPATQTPMQLVAMAVAQGADIDKLTKLMDLQDRYEKNEARKAFVVALNSFKASPPEVLKSSRVNFGNTKYAHASLDTASEIIGAALAVHDISHRWNVEQDGGKIKITCILTHALGHSESVTMEATPDTSGSKNSIQAIGSTVSYLQRYTLFAASGIAPKNVDDDGRGGVAVHEMDPRTKADFIEQINALNKPKDGESLWQTIAQESTKAGDVEAYAELKAAIAAKIRALKAPDAGAP